ncbi:hypothetical protein AVEN_18104-1 [Araneus ventricosus]|uniref:SOCS box domain-containing protein n=1 Tax=Araneus ventricosus TaxID=182803 RepID=A0A4Y2R1X5_ARAVE|nr:hypothetical protein AVEN_18104-1 [Araneus ventricosus]
MDIPIEGLEYPTENGSGRINCFLAMQTFLVFLSNSVSGSQALKLLWRSIPTRFLTFDAFKGIYGRILTPREIEDVYNFYRDIIGQDVPVCHPRMLKHLCRLTIRAILGENEHLPEGIGDLGLPPGIQSYLQLQK